MPGYDSTNPDQIIPTKEADVFKWGEDIIKNAIAKWVSSRTYAADTFQKMRNSYNGVISAQDRSRLDSMYGVRNRMPFADFRLSRNKLDTLLGEFLIRPIKATPQVANKELKNKKKERKNRLLGMYMLKDAIEEGKKAGIDLSGGIPVPQTKEEAIAMSDYQSKAEIFFTRVTERVLKTSEARTIYHDCLQDIGLTSEAHSRVFIDEFGKEKMEHISPEDAIFEEVKNDPFCEKSCYKGARIWMTKSQVLQSFSLTPDEKNIVLGWFNSSGQGLPQTVFQTGHQIADNMIAVFHIEWKGLEAWVTKTQDTKGKTYESSLSHEFYEENKTKLSKDKRITIDARYKERLFEGYCLGQNIIKNIRKARNTTESYENPYAAPYTYQNLLFNTVGGIRVPFFALMEEVKWQYNWVRNCINKELAKFKGTAFGYNRALLPTSSDGKPVTMNYILWRIVNDGVIDYSSAAESNFSGKDISIDDFFKATDLGVTATLETLIRLGGDLERLVDRLSSVNDNRQGLTSASETATNAENNITSSRTITEPMMFFFDKFMEKGMKSVLDCYRIRALINPEQVAEEIGEDAEMFFSDIDVSTCEIGVYMENTRAIESIRQRIQKYIEVSLNAGELAIPDAFEVEVSQTVAEAKQILRNSWNSIQKLKQEAQERDSKAQAEQAKQALDTTVEFREDEQLHEMEKISAKAKVKSIDRAQEGANKQKLQIQK